MGWTKRDLIKKAFAAVGLTSVDFDLPAEQLQDGLSSLDAMLAAWDSAGIRLGYPIPGTPTGGTLDQDAAIPDYACRAVFMNLAIELAAGIGREVSVRFAGMAKQSYDRLVAIAASPIAMRFPTSLPAGAGNKQWTGTLDPFIHDENDDIEVESDSELEFK